MEAALETAAHEETRNRSGCFLHLMGTLLSLGPQLLLHSALPSLIVSPFSLEGRDSWLPYHVA